MPFPSLFPNEILLAIFALCSPRTLASISRSTFLFLQLANSLLYRDPLEVITRQVSQLQVLFALPQTSPQRQLQSRAFNLQTLSIDRVRTVRIFSLLGRPSREVGRGVVRTTLEVNTLVVQDPFLLLDTSIATTRLTCRRLVVDCRTSSNKQWTEFRKSYKWWTDPPSYLACREVVLVGGELVRYHQRQRRSSFPSYLLTRRPIRFLLFPRKNHDQASSSWEELHRGFANSRQDFLRGRSIHGLPAGLVVVEVDGEAEREWVESGFEISSKLRPEQKRVFRVGVRESKDLWEDVE